MGVSRPSVRAPQDGARRAARADFRGRTRYAPKAEPPAPAPPARKRVGQHDARAAEDDNAIDGRWQGGRPRRLAPQVNGALAGASLGPRQLPEVLGDASGIRTCIGTEPFRRFAEQWRQVESSAGVRSDRLETSKGRSNWPPVGPSSVSDPVGLAVLGSLFSRRTKFTFPSCRPGHACVRRCLSAWSRPARGYCKAPLTSPCRRRVYSACEREPIFRLRRSDARRPPRRGWTGRGATSSRTIRYGDTERT